jgi:hypothetical protein
MMDSPAAISCGWTFIKGVMWPSLSRLDALVENALLLPKAKDIFFQLNKLDLSVYLSEHG